MFDQYGITKSVVEKFGVDKQIIKTMEECAELVQILAKWLTISPHSTPEIDYHIAEEVADVEIMLYQIKYMFDNFELVDEYREQKLTRLMYLLQHGKYPSTSEHHCTEHVQCGDDCTTDCPHYSEEIPC